MIDKKAKITIRQDMEALESGGETKIVRRSVLDKIFKEMMNIRCRLDDIEKSFSNWNPQPLEVPDTEVLQLPDHLRRTYLTVTSRGECEATVVSSLTGRCRAVESNYLNQLTRMGWLNKRRISKTINFRPVSEETPVKTSIFQSKYQKTN
jgi:hypothetical protein